PASETSSDRSSNPTAQRTPKVGAATAATHSSTVVVAQAPPHSGQRLQRRLYQRLPPQAPNERRIGTATPESNVQPPLLRHRLDDTLGTVDPVGADLHDAAAAVGHQELGLAVLLIDDHIERPIAIAEFSDGLSLDLGAGFQVADGELHERRAGVGGQQMLLF